MVFAFSLFEFDPSVCFGIMLELIMRQETLSHQLAGMALYKEQLKKPFPPTDEIKERQSRMETVLVPVHIMAYSKTQSVG